LHGAVAPRALELQHNIKRAIAVEPLVGDRRARDVATKAFELLALMSATTHRGVQAKAKAVRIGAQGCRSFLIPPGHRALAQHLLPCP